MQDISQSHPISLQSSDESKVYGLFAFAMAISALGVYFGIQFTEVLIGTGIHFFFLIAELIIIFTAGFWKDKSPLNYFLFAAFPLLSGFTITPYLLSVLAGYVNGGAILLNAGAATVFMAAAAAVFVRSTSMDLSVLGRTLFMALIGLLILMIAQFFVPALKTTQFELIISGAGIVIFALFTAYDLQRIQHQSRAGMSPFLLALSLYLDIFNLFLFILRFMLVIAGDRR
ncbi:Bax inhibitor-1/YccA family protein [Patescibacteria group bacterium]|nr:Bax inhibitor-1/YccA family protein [Patescibacteria group bacterium]MBU1123435.1 Bax inhibitor-1/YccA family protein [Patescibacteria group bacterium]MBU1910886.1 Bax inhibitor-1/YccA family protein [Patescibacteria group bacterium]